MRLFSWLRERITGGRSSASTRARKAKRPSAPHWRPRVEALEDRALLSTIPVTSSLDDVSQRGTLRYAVAHAGDGDTILLTGAVAQAGITLTQGELILAQQNLTIASASKSNPVTINGENHSRVFEIATGASVALSNLTITGGNGAAGIVGRPHENRGGGILVDEGSTLTITGSTVTANSAAVLGGGIADYGTLVVNGCTVSDNHALGTYGGGIAVFSGAPFTPPFTATLTIADSTITGNDAHENGGGITSVFSTVTVNNCVVTGNSASVFDGGGLNNHGGTMTVSHSRVDDNSARFGGGIINYHGTLTVTDSDVDGNSALFGGGIDNSGTLTVLDSRLSQNTASYSGGALYNEFGGTVTMARDALTHNTSGSGGAIVSFGALTMNDSVLFNNSASYGGAIYNGATMTIEGSLLDSNFTTDWGQGGAIINYGGMLTIDASQITNNSSNWGGGIDNEVGTISLSDSLLSGNFGIGYYSRGGAIFNYDTLNIDGCTLSDNTASSGGGIANEWIVTASNSDFSGNSATDVGGAIYNDGFLTIDACTLSGNSASVGGGVFNDWQLAVGNSDFSDNTPDSIFNAFFSSFIDNGGNTGL